MNIANYSFDFLLKTVNYKLSRHNLIKPMNPITLTYSVTAMCQSRCKTCKIGERFKQEPQRAKHDLKLDEIEKIFKSIGHIWFFNISGGEPFLRKDLPQIVELACKYLTPRVIHSPTNALMPERIGRQTEEILKIIQVYNPKIPFTIKPSIDGIGEIHDEIRGVNGNFKRLLQTIGILKEVEKSYPQLHLELGTVVSNFNKDHLEEIENFVHSLGVESYRNEIAERRSEFFNQNDPITPDADTYERLMHIFSEKIIKNIHKKRRLAKMTESLRLVYYNLAIRILRENRQVIPCLAGISNVHINYDGEVWPCCILGYEHPMGFLRKKDYNFQKIWHSKHAKNVRKFIASGGCACPVANQAYSNILFNWRYLSKVVWTMLKNM